MKNNNTDLKHLNGSVGYCYKSYILNKCCSYLTFYSSKNPEKVSQVFNIANKSALHKMH